MTFSVRQAIADADLEPFPYEDADGDMQELPHAKMLSAEQALRVFFDGDIQNVINEATDSDQGTVLMRLPSVVLEQLIQAWFEHSDVEMSGGAPGKSPARSRSSSATAKPSKRTSRSGGSRSRR